MDYFSEPSVRGVLLAYSNTSGTLGIFTVYLLNTIMSWRTAAFVCMFVPIVTLISLCFVSSFSSFSPLISISVQIVCRFLRRHYGCYRRIDVMRQRKHFVGSAVGFRKNPSIKSFKHCSATVNIQDRVTIASKMIGNVLIHRQRYLKSFPY